tara:strand:- start:200 stop:364 length:165 start_codon:yes stop_codon:yes gene_type:complete
MYATQQRYRITLDLDVIGDINPREIDWYKVLSLEEFDKVNVAVEDFNTDEIYYI